MDTKGKYSWIKSPLYDDERMEVGPLARMIIGVAKGDEKITKYVTTFLKMVTYLQKFFSQQLVEQLHVQLKLN